MKNRNNAYGILKILLATVIAPCSSFAQADTTHGGDAIVTSSGALRLQDLIDTGNCTWKSGKAVLAGQPQVEVILSRLSEANPYFSSALREQILKISWCYTATLPPNTDNDDSSLTYYKDPYEKIKVRVGVRVINNVFIDRRILDLNFKEGAKERMLKAEDRPYFYIHEAMHAFLPMQTPDRHRRVRDAVKAIRDYYVGDTNVDDLDVMIVGTKLLVPTHDSVIQPLSKILNQTLSIQQRVELASPVLNPYNDNEISNHQWNEVAQYVSDADLTKLTKMTGKTRFEFLRQTRGLISFPTTANGLMSFIGAWPRALTSFGGCFIELEDLSNTNHFIDYRNSWGSYTRTPGYRKTDNGYNWARIVNNNSRSKLNIPRHEVYEDYYQFFRYQEAKGAEQIMWILYYQSFCDFTPIN